MIPIFIGWIYSELLEYRKSFFPLKPLVLFFFLQCGLLFVVFSLSFSLVFDWEFAFLYCSHSDNNLVELGGVVGEKDDDKADLLEGGLPRSASLRFHNSSIRTNIIRLVLLPHYPSFLITTLQLFSARVSLIYRFLSMEDSFLLEHRATLRAM